MARSGQVLMPDCLFVEDLDAVGQSRCGWCSRFKVTEVVEWVLDTFGRGRQMVGMMARISVAERCQDFCCERSVCKVR